jgi:cytochrome c551/c552
VAETPATDKLVKTDPDAPAPDPITSSSTSGILLVCALLMMASLAWALWDEVYGTRPWKGDQQTFVKRYKRYLTRIKKKGFQTEKQVRESDAYRQLVDEARAAREAVQGKVNDNNKRVKSIDTQLAAISDPFQDTRGRITVASYEAEMADERSKARERKDVDELKRRRVKIAFPNGDGSRTEQREFNFESLEKTYTSLKEERGRLLTENGELLKEAQELEKKRDEYLKDNVTEVTEQQVKLLTNKLNNFSFGIRQINVNGDLIVDRCETCHLAAREPIKITASDMMVLGKRPDRLARAFVSHPNRELLQIHDAERFGCSSCHWGNGRATTSITKGHGRHRFWMHSLFEKENTEAGCNQCHSGDRVLQGAPTLTLGKDLFSERGCVGCHRYEGFDRETDALSNARQQMKQFEEEIANNERDAKAARNDSAAPDVSDEQAQKLLARAEALVVANSQIESRLDQLNTQARYLMQDQKKVGPNLKDIRLKLRKEWIPVWLQDPQAFRPGTKMPSYWYLSGDEKKAKGNIVPGKTQEDERKAIAAYLWQAAFEGQLPAQPKGDPARGKELFETTGCMACHSINQGDQAIGGDFAANLTRVGEKANYDYIVRWVHNPRERWAPYCPKHGRDLTPDDYAKHNKPYVFDTKHSRCPEDGAELQVQNMTVMPNFRLADQDARDIASYLVSLSPNTSFPDASFMDDPSLKDRGRTLIKQYGCAGCHEIRGFEDEQRIGKELSAEGATPLERLDFAMLTHKAELGIDPFTGKRMDRTERPRDSTKEGWYDHKGFFENKLEEPSIYDLGKEKEPREHLRMPKPFLRPEWKVALTTFLMGSVGVDGANVPAALFYQPSDQQKAIQDGWWVIKKYNCMGCHNVQVGQRSDLSLLPQYEAGGALGKEQLPPGLTTEGARVDPDWLLRFLSDPSLSGGEGREAHGAPQPTPARSASAPAANGAAPSTRPSSNGASHAALKPQPGANRNGVRTYLKVRMPTFNFSPNELRTLVRFFLAVSAQQEPYIKETPEPLTDSERELARALFTSQAAPCLKCHMTGDATHDRTATAPSFLVAGERLKTDWTYRWLLDPQRIMPGTAMPSELFKHEGERWVFNGPLPPAASQYNGDHARLLVRYLLQMTPEEQARSSRTTTLPAPGPAATPAVPAVASHRRTNRKGFRSRRIQNAARRSERRPRHVASIRRVN